MKTTESDRIDSIDSVTLTIVLMLFRHAVFVYILAHLT